MRIARHDRAGAGLPGRALPRWSDGARRARRSTRRCAAWPAALGVARRRDLRARPATSGRTLGARDRASRAARAGAADGDRAAGRRAVRHDRRRPRHVHDVPRLRRARARRARCSTARRRRSCASSKRNCVQCGLCAETCPEHAITLSPRLDLTPEARGAAGAERGRDLRLHHAAASRWAPRR